MAPPEEIWFGDSTHGPGSDLANATLIAARMLGNYAMGESVLSYAILGDNPYTGGELQAALHDPHTRDAIRELLADCKREAVELLRRTALIYGRDGDRYLVVASKGGSRTHPLWYLNLTANPEVQVQVGAEKFTARARTASPEEKPRLWRLMAEIWPDYDRYQQRTSREIPVVILERV